MGKRNNVRSARGCLGILIVFAVLCAVAVLGYQAVRSHLGSFRGPEGISDFVPDTGQYAPLPMDSADIHRGELILVNGDAPYRFPSHDETVSVYDCKSDSYKVRDKDVLLARDIIGPFNRMMDDFYAESHTRCVNIISGYRSYDYQQALLDNEIARLGSAEAYRWVAQPGESEHHTGLAFDLGIYQDNGVSAEYKGAGKYAWINQNAHRYGFIIRYEEDKSAITGIAYEPWHFRYVGIPHAHVMHGKDLCMEEYIEYLRDFRYGERHLLVRCEGQSYEIYFTEGTDVYVPRDKEYRISGNNVDGFIVTVPYGK